MLSLNDDIFLILSNNSPPDKYLKMYQFITQSPNNNYFHLKTVQIILLCADGPSSLKYSSQKTILILLLL